jgi:hypothetical protein
MSLSSTSGEVGNEAGGGIDRRGCGFDRGDLLIKSRVLPATCNPASEQARGFRVRDNFFTFRNIGTFRQAGEL